MCSIRNAPLASAMAAYGYALSGRANDSTTAPAAGVPATQSKTLPLILVCGIVPPVEKNVVTPVLRTLPRMSATPFCMITVYAVLGSQPCPGFTPITSRCYEADGAPFRGEIR